jgi:hypothetical protein
MRLLIEETDKKVFLWGYLLQIAIYFSWYILIYGILGHVCPVAFLGPWSASIIGSVYYTSKKPRFLGCFISLIITILIWGFTFLFLHPNDVFGWKVDDPYRIITFGPYLMFFVNTIVSVVIQVVITRKMKPWKTEVSNKLENLIEKLLSILTILIGTVGFAVFFFFKDDINNNNVIDWFDTQFYPGDQWILFLFIMFIALFSAIMMLYSYYQENKNRKISKKIISLTYLLGYTFLGLVVLGTIGIFIYLGTQSEELKLQ